MENAPPLFWLNFTFTPDFQKMLFLRLFKESIVFAYQALTLNKLRSLLSLLGISIGIFSIIAVFTLVDALEKGLRDGVSALGDDVVFVQKWPWGGGPDFEWWEYWQRPHPNYRQFKDLQQRNIGADAMSFQMDFRRSVSYEGKMLKNMNVEAVSEEYPRVKELKIGHGRFMSTREIRNGSGVAVIGDEIATKFFNFPEAAIGKQIKLGSIKVTVIGVFEKEGAGISFDSADDKVLTGVQFARSLVTQANASSSILVKAKTGVGIEGLKDRITGAFRAVRRLRPNEKDDFSLNESSALNKQLDGLFGVINTAGVVIGLFSILVGGFSIANIMFVSVKERTNLIGIQKSLGAKSYFVLLQFLFEAIFLAIGGGIIGLLIVFIGTVIGSLAADMAISLTLKNIGLGISISAVIGLIAGLAPASQAARMNPVDAIRSN